MSEGSSTLDRMGKPLTRVEVEFMINQPATITVAETRHTYKVWYSVNGETLEEILDGGELLVRGPLRSPGGAYTWFGGGSQVPTGDDLMCTDAPDDLTAEARLVADVWVEVYCTVPDPEKPDD